jgi:uncharacterized low-complexity protein
MNRKNDMSAVKIAGLIGGSLVLGALASAPRAASAAPVSYSFLGSGAEVRSHLLGLNQYGEDAKKPESKTENCKCPEGEDKSEEGKCGEGKCGAEESAAKECKCPDAKSEPAKSAKAAEDKSEEGKCGEGKCG